MISTLYESFLHACRYQEAVWLLRSEGYEDEAQRLEQWLVQSMSSTAAVAKKKLGGGATRTYLVTLANGISGVFKPRQYNPSANMYSEAGAYRLDRLLNLNVVPCTVLRKVHFFRYAGSFQYFVAQARLASSLDEAQRIKPAAMLLLDFLMDNRDRYPGNYMYLASIDKMLAIDNGWGLRGNGIVETVKGYCIDRRTDRQRREQITFASNQEFDPRLYANLKNLEISTLLHYFNPLIGTTATRKLLERHEIVLQALVARFTGSENPASCPGPHARDYGSGT